MPDYVFADAAIGSMTWKVGSDAGIASTGSGTCPDTGTLISTIYTEGGSTWSSSSNGRTTTFEVYGPSVSSGEPPWRADCHFGLSNRVRSVNVTTMAGQQSLPADPTANNNLKINLGRVDNLTASPPLIPDYPNTVRFLRAIAGESSSSQQTGVNVVDEKGDSIYGCGFCMHLEARSVAGNKSGGTPHWIVNITPSESVI